MAVTISFTITDDTKAARIGDAFDAAFAGRTDEGLTKTQWVKKQIVEYVRQVTRNQEGNVAASTARSTNDADVNNISIT